MVVSACDHVVWRVRVWCCPEFQGSAKLHQIELGVARVTVQPPTGRHPVLRLEAKPIPTRPTALGADIAPDFATLDTDADGTLTDEE